MTVDRWTVFWWWARVVLLLLAFAGLFWLAYELRAVFNPLLIALGIAYALNPLVVKLSEKRWFFGNPVGRTGPRGRQLYAFAPDPYDRGCDHVYRCC